MYEYLFGIKWLPMYAVMIVIGCICCGVYILLKLIKDHTPRLKAFKIIVICAISGGLMYLGAWFFDGLFHSIETYGWDVLLKLKWEEYGITFMGGVFTAIVSFTILYLWIFKMDKKEFMKYLNIAIVGVIIAHAFGRIGCFCAGCCYGKPTDSIFGVEFPKYSFAWWDYHNELGDHFKVYPTMLFESAFLFILFGAMVIFDKQIGSKKFPIYSISYGIFRFLLEYLRGDDRGSTGFFLSPSQLLCLIFIIGGVILLIRDIKLSKKENEPENPIQLETQN